MEMSISNKYLNMSEGDIDNLLLGLDFDKPTKKKNKAKMDFRRRKSSRRENTI